MSSHISYHATDNTSHASAAIANLPYTNNSLLVTPSPSSSSAQKHHHNQYALIPLPLSLYLLPSSYQSHVQRPAQVSQTPLKDHIAIKHLKASSQLLFQPFTEISTLPLSHTSLPFSYITNVDLKLYLAAFHHRSLPSCTPYYFADLLHLLAQARVSCMLGEDISPSSRLSAFSFIAIMHCPSEQSAPPSMASFSNLKSQISNLYLKHYLLQLRLYLYMA
jgi:hypothetical protein